MMKLPSLECLSGIIRTLYERLAGHVIEHVGGVRGGTSRERLRRVEPVEQ